jgi:short-subunit dehydrogenase
MTRAIIITGASAGIGAATALALAAPDTLLVLVARRADLLEQVASQVRAAGGQAAIVAEDVTASDGPERIAAAAETAAAAAGARLAALVNNAGAFLTAKAGEITRDHLDRLWRLNLQAPILLTQAVLPALRRNGGGTIVNVSSVAADTAFAGCGVYSATKAGLESWSRVLREELRRERIKVCVLAPGATATEAWPPGAVGDPGRVCRPEDIAAGVRAMLDAAPSASIDRLAITPPLGPL